MSRPARRRPPKRRTSSARRAKPAAARSRRAAPKAKAKRAARRATAPVRKARGTSGTGGRAKTSPAPRAPGALVSTEWLAARLGHPRLVVLDGSWHMPQLKRDAREEFDAAHLPGARFFDIDAIADQRTSLPHMLPAAPQFAEQVGALGIGTGDLVVVYDTRGVISAARVWWTFRAMGHDRVAVLDGGLPLWRAEGRAGGERPPRGGAPALQGAAAPGARAHARADAGQPRGAARAGPRRAIAGTLRGHGAGAPRGASRRAYPEEPQPAL